MARKFTLVVLLSSHEKLYRLPNFKEQCLALLDRVGPDGILVTKHGKPVAKLMPVHTNNANLISSFKGKIKIKGNILSTGIEC